MNEENQNICYFQKNDDPQTQGIERNQTRQSGKVSKPNTKPAILAAIKHQSPSRNMNGQPPHPLWCPSIPHYLSPKSLVEQADANCLK